MSDVHLFDHFEYATNIIAVLKNRFPELNTVAFQSDPHETHFKDLALPAFVMYFANPVYLSDPARVDPDADDTYYMKIELHVVGDLVLPDFNRGNRDVPDDVNTHILLATAATNIAALIRSGQGLEAPQAKLGDINYFDDEVQDYHHATIQWHHDVFIGSHPEAGLFGINEVINTMCIPFGEPRERVVYREDEGHL